MFEYLLELDRQLLLLINKAWAHPLLDSFLPWWTDLNRSPLFWVTLVGSLSLGLYRAQGLNGLKVLAFCFLVVGLSDAIGGQVLKPLINRPRPPFQGIDVLLRAPTAGGGSFPSNHAMNTFCLAAFLGVLFPQTRKWLFPIAGITAYSRVYSGVHFPSDVLGGALLGSLIGLGAAMLLLKYPQHRRKNL